MKRGPKPKFNSACKLRLKQKICNSKHIGEKLNFKKLINLCDIPVSRHTIARYLKQQVVTYEKIRRSLPQEPLNKLKREDFVKKWL